MILVVVGIIVVYRAIVLGNKKKSLESNRFLKDISPSISKYFQTLNEMVGVTATEVLFELLMRSALLLATVLVLSQVLALSVLQILCLTLLFSFVFALWVQGTRARYMKKYVEGFELDFSDFVESLALAINSGLPLISGLTRVIAEHLGGDLTDISQNHISKMRKYRIVVSKNKQKRGLSPLQRELLFLQSRLETGVSVSSAFSQVSLRLNSALLSNFSDAITMGITRGTPLSNMLSDHADSIRESQKRILLERAGRAEVKMMVPVVFLLLPISVLFALWPSFQQLQQLVIIP